MRTLIIDNHTKHLKELCDLFPNSEIITKENFNENFDIWSFQLIILSGGSDVPTVFRHPEEYSKEINLIRNSHIPILGICLGNEIIVEAFGGSLQDLPEEHRGTTELKISDKGLKKEVGSTTIKIKESHKIGVLKLPKEIVSCASSGHGIEITKHKTRPIVGLGFHPEMLPNKGLLTWLSKTLELEKAPTGGAFSN